MRTLTTLLGNSQKLDGGAMFGNAPRALWERWMPADELHRIDLGCRALLVREDGRNILVETGIGAFFSPELKERYGVQESRHVLLDSLAAQGLSDADIDVVVLTHLHFDHAGGLLAPWEEGQQPCLLFPNARFITGRRQWQRALQPHARDRASYIPELLDDGQTSETLGPDWRFHVSDGHTPGQLLPEVAMPGGPVLFAGDLEHFLKTRIRHAGVALPGHFGSSLLLGQGDQNGSGIQYGPSPARRRRGHGRAVGSAGRRAIRRRDGDGDRLGAALPGRRGTRRPP
ncbi:MBL fold metallo-hydrolase, partial [Azotobacter beijerinckii]